MGGIIHLRKVELYYRKLREEEVRGSGSCAGEEVERTVTRTQRLKFRKAARDKKNDGGGAVKNCRLN